MAWNPSQYLKFADHRLRPALDLLVRVPCDRPWRVYDLGCGAGNVTRQLLCRWPGADIVAVDSSAEMLEAAALEPSPIRWVQADLAHWSADQPADVVYSNAALHWLDDHPALFRHLMDQLAPHGVLAVQMPRNHTAPSHTCMIDAAAAGPWADTLLPLLRPGPVAEPAVYYDLLAPLCATLDIWETEYMHVLDGDNPVVAWTKGTALKPLLDALAAPHRAAFLADYAARIAKAYPPRADGKTLLPFRRTFIVARR